jgi:intracellular septation protein A
VGAGGDSGQYAIRLQAPTRVRDLGLPLVSAASREPAQADPGDTDADQEHVVEATDRPPSIAATDLFDAPPEGRRNKVRWLLPSLLVNAAAPYVAFQVLTGQGVDTTTALAASTVFPAIAVVWGFARTRNPDMIGLVSLIFIALGVGTSLVSGDPRFILIKESLLTGVFGLACLGSLLLAPRPLIFYFSRQFVSVGDPARAAAFESMWQRAGFRTVIRRMTLVWGVGFMIEALVRVGLTFVLPIPVFLVVSHVLAAGVTIGLISWTIAYGRRSARRAAVARGV